MYQVFVIRAAIDDGDDFQKWRQYGVSEMSEFDAKEALRRFFKDREIDWTEMEIVPGTGSLLASLNLKPGCIKLVH